MVPARQESRSRHCLAEGLWVRLSQGCSQDSARKLYRGIDELFREQTKGFGQSNFSPCRPVHRLSEYLTTCTSASTESENEPPKPSIFLFSGAKKG